MQALTKQVLLHPHEVEGRNTSRESWTTCACQDMDLYKVITQNYYLLTTVVLIVWRSDFINILTISCINLHATLGPLAPQTSAEGQRWMTDNAAIWPAAWRYELLCGSGAA